CPVKNNTPACVARRCAVGTCHTGWADCNNVVSDGCETDLMNSAAHCGGCNQGCTIAHATARCAAGQCAIDTCIQPFGDCNREPGDGCEVATPTDLMNCGVCGNVCSSQNATASCDAGTCKLRCVFGYGDCNLAASDGCESALASDPKNCGGCGNACVLPNA